ncbi:hypothetical protein [Mycobacterium neumannii]|uniref:hypothetical protein n=1 Tax=Mycobacterium neumannii TaxID=2048551 RepID=UPI003AB77B93
MATVGPGRPGRGTGPGRGGPGRGAGFGEEDWPPGWLVVMSVILVPSAAYRVAAAQRGA